ncbi:MAG: hypothetical protein WKG07_13870 [Hymenobacter sp.]
MVIPNAELFINAVTVNTAYDKRRLQYDIGIGYGDDIATARQLILEALRGIDDVLTDPAPEALVVDLAGSSVNIRARWWINPPRRADFMAAQDKGLEAIKNTLTAHGIDLPFPTQQILLHDQTEVTDGDRKPSAKAGPPAKATCPNRVRRCGRPRRRKLWKRRTPKRRMPRLSPRLPLHSRKRAPRRPRPASPAEAGLSGLLSPHG